MKHLSLFESYAPELEDPQYVYHGSRHKFDDFDSSMFGEGEGASGFGQGIYFTDSLDDAQGYAEKLEHKRHKGYVYLATIPNASKFYNLDARWADQSEYVKNCFLRLSRKQKIWLFESEYEAYVEEHEAGLESGDYDEPLSEEDIDYILNQELETFGNHLFDHLKERFNEDDQQYHASEFLAQIGIKGTQHRQFGDHHFIVFNDEDTEVIQRKRWHKYDQNGE